MVTIFYELDLSPKVLVAGLPDEPSAYQRVNASASVHLCQAASNIKSAASTCGQAQRLCGARASVCLESMYYGEAMDGGAECAE